MECRIPKLDSLLEDSKRLCRSAFGLTVFTQSAMTQCKLSNLFLLYTLNLSLNVSKKKKKS